MTTPDYLDGLNEMTSSMGNGETASKDFQGGGQKGLDYSVLDYDVVEWVPAPHGKTNKFDIICFLVTQDWYKKLLYPPPTQDQKDAGQKYATLRNRDIGQADISLEIPFHRFADGNSGDVVCLREAFGEPCAHCDEMFELFRKAREDGKPECKQQAKDLFKISWRSFINIFNYNKNPEAPEDHDGYEVINDMSNFNLMKNIQECSTNTELGEGFVYTFGDPTENGYTLTADSIYKKPTSEKFNKGHFEFPVVKFQKREKGVDYTIKDPETGLDDVQQSVSFDALVTPLIYTYEEMKQMAHKKMAKEGVEPKQPKEEAYDTDQSNNSYAGTPEGNGNINEIPEQQAGTDSNGEAIDDTNSYDQTASSGRPGRRQRGPRADKPEETPQTPQTPPEVQKEAEVPVKPRRRRK